jgi:hypothetical protein
MGTLISSAASSRSIAFATHAYWRDFEIVLDPDRFRMVVESHRHQFSAVIVALNNFRSERERGRARRKAERLVSSGLASVVLDTHEYLSDEVLASIGLDHARYWTRNPYFSTGQFAALHWSLKRADYLLHMTGDSYLRWPVDWIPRALDHAEKLPDMVGFNLCRGGHSNLYRRLASEETDHFWISSERIRKVATPRGFTISDLGYVILTNPGFRWHFTVPPKTFVDTWVDYARPGFESYLAWAIFSNKRKIGALKLGYGAPSLGHKNFPKSKLETALYRALGRYKSGGRHATAISQHA